MASRDNHVSQQSQNQGSDYHISNVVNDRLKQVSENNGGKDIYLTQTLLTLGPLGLKFSNTDSFLELVGKSISDAENTENVSRTNRNPVHGAVQAKAVIDAEKFKASNISALSLTIGSWKEVPNREGALVAKFHYAKKQLVWEIMEESLKSKIEIRWIDIVGITASIVANEHGILGVELGTQPAFFQEYDPEPRKHARWEPSQDFTNGQALIHRIHYLEFPPRVLEKHYEKLLQSDSRLLELSQTSFPNIPCPYFPSVSYNGNGSNIAGPGPGSQPVQAHYQIHQPCLSTGINSTVFFDSNGNGSNIAELGPGWQPVQAHNQIHQPCLSIKDQTGSNSEVIFLDSNGNGSNIAGPGPGPGWQPVQAHNQIHQPCLSIKDQTCINSDVIFLDSNGSNIAGPGPGWQPVQAHNQIHQPYLSIKDQTGSNSDVIFLDSNGNGSNIARPGPGPGPSWQSIQAHNQIHQPCLSIKDQTGSNSDVIFLDSNGNGSNIAGPGPGPGWQPVQAHNQIYQPCLSIKDPTDMDFSLPQVVSNQLGVNNPGMAANTWNQPLSTSFGETQLYQIQHSLSTDTQKMGYQIQQPGFTDTQITQVMGYQIEPPFSIDTQVMGYQIDQPATSFQNNVSAPCDDREGAGRAISEAWNNENLMNPLMMYEELECINNQNDYMQCDDGAGPGLQ